MKITLVTLVLLSFVLPVTAQWSSNAQFTIGSSSIHSNTGYQKTKNDRRFILSTAGEQPGNDQTQSGNGLEDAWFVEINEGSQIVKQWIFGGLERDFAEWVGEFSNGDLLFVISTYSSYSGSIHSVSYGDKDIVLFRVTNQNQLVWEKRIGGSEEDTFSDMFIDENDLIHGLLNTESSNSGTISVQSNGELDYYLFRLSGDGQTVFQKLIGGERADFDPVFLLKDGFYYIVGDSYSYPSTQFPNPLWGDNILLLKVDMNGTIINQRVYGGSLEDMIPQIQFIDDHLHVYCRSTSGVSWDKTVTNNGNQDIWHFSVDLDFNMLDQHSYGGSGLDAVYRVSNVFGYQYIMGISNSPISGSKTSLNHGQYDGWLLVIDEQDQIVFDESFGGSKSDYVAGVDVLWPGEVNVILGSLSPISGNKTVDTYSDHSTNWILNMYAPLGLQSVKKEIQGLQLYPNPSMGIVSLQLTPTIQTPVEIKVTDPMGRTLFIDEINLSQANTLNLTHLPQGSYLIHLNTENQDLGTHILIIE